MTLPRSRRRQVAALALAAIGGLVIAGRTGRGGAAAGPDDDAGPTASAQPDGGAGAGTEERAGAGVAPSPIRQGFDHLIHESKIAASGGADLDCAGCHRLDRQGAPVGKPGHASCFGACHGATPTGKPRQDEASGAADDRTDREAVCVTCHAPAALAARYAPRPAAPRR